MNGQLRANVFETQRVLHVPQQQEDVTSADQLATRLRLQSLKASWGCSASQGLRWAFPLSAITCDEFEIGLRMDHKHVGESTKRIINCLWLTRLPPSELQQYV